MCTNFYNFSTVAFFNGQKKSCNKTLRSLECSVAQLFIHISQNNEHIRLQYSAAMINYDVFMFDKFYL